MFQLGRISILRHPVFGTVANLNFGLLDEAERNTNEVFSTVVIGENGVGKSYLLRSIADIFELLHNRKSGLSVQPLPYRFEVEYILDGYTYIATTIPQDWHINHRLGVVVYRFYKNGSLISNENLALPSRVITTSMTVSDKFNAKSSNFYMYRGLRNERTPSTTGTRTLVRKVVDGIMDSLREKQTSREELKNLLRVLGFDEFLEIKYKIHYKDIYYSYCDSPVDLIYLYDHLSELFPTRQSKLWGATYFNSIRNDWEKLEKICVFLRYLRDNDGQYGSYAIVFNPLDVADNMLLYKEAIRLASSLDILQFPELNVSKNKIDYSYVESSSGETCQLCQFINIMSAIEDNSLVLIDEPETSLHPNWQMQYVKWLEGTFRRYSNSHLVIATHSHFLLSNLKPDHTSIIALKKEEDGMSNIACFNTYCWSTDEILYRVFHVRNTRNWYFEDRMRELYNLISNGRKDSVEARTLVEELRTYQLSDQDPLLKLLEIAD